jgi:hypothetical protein
MATDRQIAANRRNGALSRGPKTAAGKARSSRNALKHGLAIPITRDRATARKRTDRGRSQFRARSSSGGIGGSGCAHEHQPYVKWTGGYVQYWIRKICRADLHLGGARQAGSL